jgi:hypothetical protein
MLILLNINNTITSFLQTNTFTNYTNNVSSTFTSIINTNTCTRYLNTII